VEIDTTQDSPDFVYLANGSHYDLAIKKSTYPAAQFAHLTENTGRYGHNASYTDGYFYSQGITDYALSLPSQSREKVANLIRNHMDTELLPIPVTAPVVAIVPRPLLPEYREKDVLDINRLTNQLLDQVFNGSRISDATARMVTEGLERITKARSNQERLHIIGSLESRFNQPLTTRTSTVFRDTTHPERGSHLPVDSPSWPEAQAS
jgi:hypothetical protein